MPLVTATCTISFLWRCARPRVHGDGLCEFFLLLSGPQGVGDARRELVVQSLGLVCVSRLRGKRLLEVDDLLGLVRDETGVVIARGPLPGEQH